MKFNIIVFDIVAAFRTYSCCHSSIKTVCINLYLFQPGAFSPVDGTKPRSLVSYLMNSV